jgi:hypothetical protein
LILSSFNRSPFRTGPKGSSRLCKAGFLHRFKQLAAVKRYPLPSSQYQALKQAAKEYQLAKVALYDALDGLDTGRWMTNPEELNMFDE